MSVEEEEVEDGELSADDDAHDEQQAAAEVSLLYDSTPHKRARLERAATESPHLSSPLDATVSLAAGRTVNGWTSVSVLPSTHLAPPVPSSPPVAALSLATSPAASGPTPFLHYVAGTSPPLPPYSSLPLAHHFPFTLDPWQQSCLSVLHLRHHLIVSAHTSAGKSTAAEYAIALALREQRRALYCAPIKTLSNQKWREWQGTFGEVGLMTGDVTVSPSAAVLVMTTEVLRRAVFSPSSPLLQDVAVVVFDEVHYLNDEERGTVWEESLIGLLSLHDLPTVSLSATIDNAQQLADWMASLGQRPCHVISTRYRPTPLQHLVFDAQQRTLAKVKDARDQLLLDNVRTLREANEASRAKDSTASSSSSPPTRQGRKAGVDVFVLLSLCIAREWTPVIVFSFSRRDCEQLCLASSSLTLTTAHEQALITEVFTSAMASLSLSDRSLPQITSLLPLLLKGLATHHSGLLPILRELVELLFAEGLLKLLFATETFALGLNLPARTVVFTAWEKFDGRERRLLRGSEYTQMSGRAGRRGIDKQGLCISLLSSSSSSSLSSCSVEELARVLGGGHQLVLSRFTLSWSVILSVGRLQSAALDMQDVIERSFKQWQGRKEKPKLEERLRLMEAARERLQREVQGKEELLHSYQHLLDAMDQQRARVRALMDEAGSASLLRWLQAGRVVWCSLKRKTFHHPPRNPPASENGHADSATALHGRVQEIIDAVQEERQQGEREVNGAALGVQEEETVHFGWGVVVDCRKRFAPATYVVDLLLPVISSTSPLSPLPHLNPHPAFLTSAPPSAVSIDASVDVMTVSTSTLTAISSLRIFLPDDLRSLQQRQAAYDDFLSITRSHFPTDAPWPSSTAAPLLYPPPIPSSLPLLPPFDLLPSSHHPQLAVLLAALTILQERITAHPLSSLIPTVLQSLLASYRLLPPLLSSTEQVQSALLQSSLLQPFHASLSLHMQVLVALSYLTPALHLTAKGKVAAEIDSVNPLLLTELIFSAFFTPLTPPLICAALSCLLMADERGREERERAALSAELRSLYGRIEEANARLKKTVEAAGVEWKVEVRCGLMAVICAWSRGESFDAVMKLGGGHVFEGTVIRVCRRLSELLAQLVGAAQRIGSAELESCFTQASASIRRGIIFAGSLYH